MSSSTYFVTLRNLCNSQNISQCADPQLSFTIIYLAAKIFSAVGPELQMSLYYSQYVIIRRLTRRLNDLKHSTDVDGHKTRKSVTNCIRSKIQKKKKKKKFRIPNPKI